MSSARRPLLTATAAGTLLCALWFVPSAHASQDAPGRETTGAASATQSTQQAKAVSSTTAGTATNTAQDAAQGTDQDTVQDTAQISELADTGSPDTTPYVVGGTLFLAVGAGFVVYSVRRDRLGF
ncbi:LAETG motif-containing sortase-dependent surface protein [Streptomyces sp. NPDC052301]|uniref:LAETG motif-containing sortase-dependent surface protein n=1 Tax=Streptomyces sp. NPDC052301 TaxID=3365687 RepID=UPI0037D4FDB2